MATCIFRAKNGIRSFVHSRCFGGRVSGMNGMTDSLLSADEPTPVTVHNENGASPFLIVADHADNLMPRALGRLGVPAAEC